MRNKDVFIADVIMLFLTFLCVLAAIFFIYIDVEIGVKFIFVPFYSICAGIIFKEWLKHI